MNNLAIYIHWPFCKSKCPYCDFNSHVREGIDHIQWNQAYLNEINYFADYLRGKNITSIFFGGGTPTLMPPYIAANIINELNNHCKISPDAEITLEGNPTSVEANKFREFRDAGVNRVSLGVQSLNESDLKFLGREHSVTEALRAVDAASNTFENYTFDLIYARPEQRLIQWEKELFEALKYIKNHMSLYQLTIEKGTAFYGDFQKGKFQMPNDSLSADFYELTNDIMESEGLPAYEISNHAADGFQSRHNMTYWRYGDYLGIGAGAHSRITLDNKTAIMMTHNPENWLKSVQEKQHGIQDKTPLTASETIEEMVMMGLRISEGININNFLQVTGEEIKNLRNLDSLIESGLLELTNTHLRTTKQGRLLTNSITGKLLG